MDNEAFARESIAKTKQVFEKCFADKTYYNKQTQDKEHLNLIISHLPITEGMKILDLGVGMGFLSFPLAVLYPNARIVGLDIVEKTLADNRKKASEDHLSNLQFIRYDGIHFPFEKEEFDIIVTRYALHHFPMINHTFQEISRVLKPSGILFLSDPAPNDNDTKHFVDAYMQTKNDGHIKFYTKTEWINIGAEVSLEYMDGFETKIRFPKKRDTALQLDEIVHHHDDEIIKGYDLEITEDDIYITEKVNNLIFKKVMNNEV